ncbi:hypothetical protein PQ465_18945 [Sphingobacterium oryzagri]|uniref:Glycosyltransferase family 1 protein n=1 Tax=Sphingobacterium oryzagri TaxID=3025669 RepID=A0ABY7WFR0_9SPHI|nr:hypothetical protein [Sphingobacterium sp. KACC 22765]WDF68357.1 hypothetical protein PQ465_18945 [Sphingobacterium sp. KACC 22765]
MIQLQRDSKIYICAPGGKASGGPEALHQLFYYMKQLNYNVFMCYYDEFWIHPRYVIYSPEILDLNEVEDAEKNVILVPEIATKILKDYSAIKKCIWWLSLQHYDGFETIEMNSRGKLSAIVRSLISSRFLEIRLNLYKRLFPSLYAKKPYVISNKDFNLCGSKFAFEFVQKRFYKVHMFVEPLGIRFLNRGQVQLLSHTRSDLVLYNPSKPSPVMEKLLKRSDISFIPLQGYNEEEMIELFRKSKLYVDFGMFGGPERLPKETVYNGTLLLVANRNAAKNNFDVAIPQKFKLDNFDDESHVAEMIKMMICEYDSLIDDFDLFRTKIDRIEDIFIGDIKKYFVRVE